MMSDLIKRADAIEAMCKANFVDSLEQNVALEVLEALPSAEAVHRWIPVSERLPSESGWYLITVQGCEKVADMEWYYGEWDAWNGVSSEQQVLAWMPLPEPYKGGDSE